MRGKRSVFCFKHLTEKKIGNELQKLGGKKVCQTGIPVKLIKENILSPFIYNTFSDSLFSSCFPSELKNANAKPVFQKDQSNVNNYTA